jgi:hypothetical protein
MSDARTVIAGVSVTVPISPSITQTVRCTPELADAILAALADAGLVVVPQKRIEALEAERLYGRGHHRTLARNGGGSE